MSFKTKDWLQKDGGTLMENFDIKEDDKLEGKN